jgi:hypothetical protein
MPAAWPSHPRSRDRSFVTATTDVPADRRKRWIEDNVVAKVRMIMGRPRSRLAWLTMGVAVCVTVLTAYVVIRLGDDRPVTFADAEAHYKYGTTGGERDVGRAP